MNKKIDAASSVHSTETNVFIFKKEIVVQKSQHIMSYEKA